MIKKIENCYLQENPVTKIAVSTTVRMQQSITKLIPARMAILGSPRSQSAKIQAAIRPPQLANLTILICHLQEKNSND